ncbi:MAG: hypothetical protein K0S92_414 [Desertimonas sp.]|nr:hypothetical protein [Desertimonas sp.]
MRARVQHVEADGDVGGRERRVGGGLVTRLPVEDAVVGAPVDLVAHERGVGIEGLAGVDHRRQCFVLDVDQLQRVACRVPILGDDEGDLLALIADLVGGQHGLHVGRQRRHPGEAQTFEHLTGDHGAHLGVRLGRRRVDGDDPRMGVGAAEDRPVEHARHGDVVEVVAAAAQEAGVLLAQHSPEAHGVTRF